MANRIKINMGRVVKTSKSTIFNALATSATEPGDEQRMTSLSTITNSDVGVCPKCKKPMGQAIIANSDTVFYCEADRVATPLPNKE
jgi:hypothetical protein